MIFNPISVGDTPDSKGSGFGLCEFCAPVTHVSRREKLGPIVNKRGLFIWLLCFCY